MSNTRPPLADTADALARKSARLCRSVTHAACRQASGPTLPFVAASIAWIVAQLGRRWPRRIRLRVPVETPDKRANSAAFMSLMDRYLFNVMPSYTADVYPAQYCC